LNGKKLASPLTNAGWDLAIQLNASNKLEIAVTNLMAK
jgi:hypothetical protein